MLPVAVEIAPPDAPAEQVQALLSSCSRAMADADCVLAGEAPEGPTQAIAIVTWQPDGRALVEVGKRRSEGADWRSRTVSFSTQDEAIERFRTVGFVIGVLARGERPEVASEPASTESPSTPPASE